MVLGGICANQLLTQCDIARLVFYQIKDALDSFLRALQPQQIYIQKMRYSRLVFQRVLSQLKWSSKRKHSFDRSRRRNLHVIGGNFRDVAAVRQVSKTFRHARKGVIGVEKAARSGIDKGDSAGHVRQYFLVENDFALQLLRGLHLALIEPGAEPREHCRENDQPCRQDRHSSQKIVNWFVCQSFRLLH